MWIRAIQTIKLTILTVLSVCVMRVHAQVEARDSVKETGLDEVVVEAASQSMSAAVSTYYPTTKRKMSIYPVESRPYLIVSRLFETAIRIGSGH